MQNIEKFSVIEQLRKIPHGTLLNVMWLDASTVRNADLQKLPLRNDYVETRRSTVGEYRVLQQGAAQRAWHVVLRMDDTEGLGSTIRSIPACLVYKVIVSELKTAESLDKFNIAKHVLHLKGGAVKLFDIR